MRRYKTGHDEVVGGAENPVEWAFGFEFGPRSGLDHGLPLDDQSAVGDERLVGERHHRVADN